MRAELERLQLIEQQLLPGLTAMPTADWNLRQLLDCDLAEDVAAQQQLYDGLRLAGRRQLRRELAGIHTRLYGPKRITRIWAGWVGRMTEWLPVRELPGYHSNS